MKIFAVNHEIRFSCPEGFHMMDASEKNQLTFYGNGEFDCVVDPERHIIISIGWEPLRGLASLAGIANVAKTMEKRLSKSMQQYGFKYVKKKESSLDGETAIGFCYEYEAQGISMAAESFACKKNKTMYYLHVYYQKVLQEESVSVWNGIFDSMRWIR